MDIYSYTLIHSLQDVNAVCKMQRIYVESRTILPPSKRSYASFVRLLLPLITAPFYCIILFYTL